VRDPDTGAWISDAEVADISYTAFASTLDAITARLIVRRVKDARFPDALFPVCRYHPFFTNTDAPVEAAGITHRQHAIIKTVFADLIDGPLAHLPSGRFGANSAWVLCAGIAHNLLHAAGVARRRPTHPGTGIDATPQDRHRRGPAGPTPVQTRPASIAPLAPVPSLACTLAQHDWTSAATACDTLTTRRQAPPQRTGKPGQTSRYPMPTTRKQHQQTPTPLNSAHRWIEAKQRLSRG